MSQQKQDRRWEVDLLADEFGGADHRGFEEDVRQAHAESASILLRLGGAIQSYVVRQEGQDGLWYPVKAVFKWQSFVPGIRAPRPQQPPPPAVDDLLDEGDDEPETWTPFDGEPEPEPVPVAVGAGDDEGQWYVKGDNRVLARSAAEQQRLLRDGFEPEPGE